MELGVPVASLETRHGSICYRDISGAQCVCFGFLIESEEEGNNIRWQIMLRASVRMDAVNVHPAQTKEFTGSEPPEHRRAFASPAMAQ